MRGILIMSRSRRSGKCVTTDCQQKNRSRKKNIHRKNRLRYGRRLQISIAIQKMEKRKKSVLKKQSKQQKKHGKRQKPASSGRTIRACSMILSHQRLIMENQRQQNRILRCCTIRQLRIFQKKMSKRIQRITIGIQIILHLNMRIQQI